jgi:hypothetical protein
VTPEETWVAGEPLATVLGRALRKAIAAVGAAVEPVNMGLPVLVPTPPLPPVCVGEWTRDVWEKAWAPQWPRGESAPASWVFAEEQLDDIRYAVERAVRLAVVAFLDEWEGGELQLTGRRADGVVVTVPGHLRHSLFVTLHPLSDMLVPSVWRGQAPSPDVQRHSYSDLRVMRAAADPRVPTLEAFIAASGGSGSPKVRQERKIMAWLDVLHREQPEDRPNLEERTVRRRWREELDSRGVLQMAVLGLYRSPSCEHMRGKRGTRNRR